MLNPLAQTPQEDLVSLSCFNLVDLQLHFSAVKSLISKTCNLQNNLHLFMTLS